MCIEVNIGAVVVAFVDCVTAFGATCVAGVGDLIILALQHQLRLSHNAMHVFVLVINEAKLDRFVGSGSMGSGVVICVHHYQQINEIGFYCMGGDLCIHFLCFNLKLKLYFIDVFCFAMRCVLCVFDGKNYLDFDLVRRWMQVLII